MGGAGLGHAAVSASEVLILQRGLLRLIGADQAANLDKGGIPGLLRRIDQRHPLCGLPEIQHTSDHVLTVNGKPVGEGRIEKTMGAVYSLAGDTADVGMDAQTPVTDDYDPWDNAFTGTIHTVKVRHKN
jgi:hypothetical protein